MVFEILLSNFSDLSRINDGLQIGFIATIFVYQADTKNRLPPKTQCVT